MNQQFLGDNALSELLYERLITKANSVGFDSSTKNHVFITGLARAGTTAILNQLYKSNEFGSFLYKHMPFILSPRMAKIASLFNNDSEIERERYHKDGVMISNNSPECLDEVFWIKSKEDYYKNDLSEPESISIEILKGYRYLLSSYASIQNKKRLVVKNNNNHIRLFQLCDYFYDSDFVVIYRDPIAHSFSLLKTHNRFCKLQDKDKYVLDYMNLIGHREFGKGMRKFKYKESTAENHYSSTSLNYWITEWINCYQWIINKALQSKKNIHLVSYEKLCQDKHYLRRLYKKLKINNENPSNLVYRKINIPTDKSNYLIDPNLERASKKIYEKLDYFSLKEE